MRDLDEGELAPALKVLRILLAPLAILPHLFVKDGSFYPVRTKLPVFFSLTVLAPAIQRGNRRPDGRTVVAGCRG